MSSSLLFCRSRLTAADLDFLVQSLGDAGSRNSLSALMRDPDCLDRLLDDVRLFRVMLELRGCLRISAPFYFYVLVRHVLRRAEIDDPEVADYIAARLSEFTSQTRTRNPWSDATRSYDYLFELLDAADRCGGERRFRLRLHLGDYALFLSGLYPRHLLRKAAHRAAPGLEYYEQLGSASYRLAGDDLLARRLGLGPVLLTLCQAFHTARLALNRLAQELVFLDHEPAAEHLLRDRDQSS